MGLSQVGTPVSEDSTASDSAVNADLAAMDTIYTNDTISQDSVSAVVDNPAGITEIIYYPARDSTKFDFIKNRIYLYGDADVEYGDMNIKAERIEIDLAKEEVYAYGVLDSTGKEIGTPLFKQGADTYQAHEIRYNYGTQKGKIKGIVTQEGEGYLHAKEVKRMDDGSMNMVSGRYTTCDLVHPHYAINASKLKLTNSDVIVAGPFNLEIGDVPTPLGFPFGVFPTSKESRQSGVLIPTYGESRERGFFLRDGGYYFGFSDYFDMKLLGSFYTFGGFGTTLQSNYKKRYAYDGNFSAQYDKRPLTLVGDGQDQYRNDIWFEWSHRPQTRKSSSFSASVQAGSSTFNKNNARLTEDYLSNNFSSTISYSKTFTGTPFRLTASARQDQNTLTDEMNFTLPDVNFSMNRIYPFKPAGASAKGPLQQLNLAYNMNSKLKVSNIPGRLNTSRIRVINTPLDFDTIYPVKAENIGVIFEEGSQFGMKHDIPISTTVKLFKYFSLNPSFNYSEYWYPKRRNFNNVSTDSGLYTQVTEESGFYRANTYSTRADLTTRVYGIVQFRKGRLKAIRHVMTPTVGYNFKPDFGSTNFRFFDYAIDNRGEVIRSSPFEGYLYGGPTEGKTSAFSFSLQNNIEAKMAPKGDSTNAKPVKVSLIDNLGLSANYNMAADSFQLSNLNFNMRTTIRNVVTLSVNGILDPYTYKLDDTEDNSFSQSRRAIYAWNEGQGLGHLTNLGVTLGFNFNPQARPMDNAIGDTEAEREMIEYINRNPELYVDFNIPWSLQAQLNTSYSKLGLAEANTTYSLSFSGDVKLTDKWKVGFNSGYDFVNEDLTYTSLNIYRDLHCWEMRFNWIPFGFRQSYSFDINVKASVLQDLKLSKRRSFMENRAF